MTPVGDKKLRELITDGFNPAGYALTRPASNLNPQASHCWIDAHGLVLWPKKEVPVMFCGEQRAAMRRILDEMDVAPEGDVVIWRLSSVLRSLAR